MRPDYYTYVADSCRHFTDDFSEILDSRDVEEWTALRVCPAQAVAVEAPTAINIVKDYLIAHGYDGLYDLQECACRLGNLVPCDTNFSQCLPGYLNPGDEDYEWIIGPNKPESSEAPELLAKMTPLPQAND